VARNTLQALNASVCGVKLSDECVISPLVTRLLAALSTVEQWTDDYPPSPQQMRYGNVSFRTWHQRLIASTAGACTTRPAPLSGATHTLPGDRSCLPLVREGVALTTRAILARRSYGASVAGGQSCETEHSLFHVFYFRLFSIPLKDERVECRDTFALSQFDPCTREPSLSWPRTSVKVSATPRASTTGLVTRRRSLRSFCASVSSG